MRELLYSRRLRLVLVIVLAWLGVCAAGTSVLIFQRQRSLERVARYNLTWLMSQGVNEVTRLLDAVAAAGLPGSTVGADEVGLRVEILRNRVSVLRFGEAREFIASDPEFAETIEMLAGLLAEAPGLLRRIPDLGVIADLHERLELLVPRMLRIAAESKQRSGELVAGDQRELDRLHWTLVGLMGSILSCAGLLGWAMVATRMRMLAELQVANEMAEAAKGAAEAAKVAAEAANAAKTQFLANMSHELRTPLNGLLGMLELVADSELSADQETYVRMAIGSGNVLFEHISQLLEFSRIEASEIRLEAIAVDLRAMLGEVSQMMRTQMAAKGLGFSARVADGVPQWVMSDEARIRQILLNLIGNAVKFTPSGQITVAVGMDATGERVRISVQDTGIGIPADKRETIFDPFMQADVSNTRRYGGVGLGLSIVSTIVGRMGGTISLESTMGLGSIFHVVLPVGVAGGAVDVVEGEAPAVEGDVEGRPLVLLVEDDRVSREVARGFLEKAGCVVEMAVNGREAVGLFSAGRYRFVFMDRHMPEMDGITATREIRRMEAGSGGRTVIVGLSAGALASERALCLEAGMDAYLTKPIRREELRAVLAQSAAVSA